MPATTWSATTAIRERPWYGLTAETEHDPEAVAAFRRAVLGTSEAEVQVDVQAVVTYLEGDPPGTCRRWDGLHRLLHRRPIRRVHDGCSG